MEEWELLGTGGSESRSLAQRNELSY
ncbi:hypothetical protein CCACVL1_07272 [Corchorus capsularis]|uniref:Uncharacterized protein n=1 Tax=Corchorus capsularis TaxID=210143 RepID=A0A1R3J7T2_COCAP|nr:hypothetical protein CCACVL1_07272 [Corchorus capsularis]